MKTIREFFYRWTLKNHKRKALFEMECDINFLETCKSTMLRYDESKARKRMAELKKLESPSEVEQQELDKILNVLAESKATKNEWEKTKEVADQVRQYISTL